MAKKDFIHGFTYRITLFYLVLGLLWIGLSDYILEYLVQDKELLSQLQTYKGTFYVVTTGFMLYLMVRKRINKQYQTDMALREQIENYRRLNEKFQKQNIELNDAWGLASKNEQFLSTVLENIPHLVFVKDVESGNYILINQAVERFLGQSKNDIIGKNDHSIFPKEVAKNIILKDKEVIDLKTTLHYEENFESPQGSSILFSTKIPLEDTDGRIRFLIGLSQDITSHKLFEKELIAAKEKAESSDQLKTAFLRNVSHEVRTPMNGILGFSDLLAQKELDDEKKQEYITLIQLNGKRLLNVISNVLTISAIQTHQIERHNQYFKIEQLLTDLIQAHQSKADVKGLNLIVETSMPKDIAVHLDREKIYEVVSNLLDNAIKFTDKGQITISCHLDTNTNEISIIVKDTGIGIEENTKNIIFELFCNGSESIRNDYGGMGLGLTICQGLTDILGGHIQVQSEPNIGSEFMLSIPCEKVEVKPAVHENKEKYTILVAEDDDTNFLLIKTLLESEQFNIQRATNGSEAIEFAQNNPDLDLILMDIRMPMMDGEIAAKEIRKLRPEIPIIAQTAYALESNIQEYKNAFDAYITKPIKGTLLKETVNKFLFQSK